VAVPAEFREILANLGVTRLVVTNSDQCLDVYTPDRWERELDWVETLPPTAEATERYRQFYITAAQEVEIDSQGRIRVPQALRDAAGIARDVMITGDGEKIQVWDKAAWDRVDQANRLSFREIKNKLAEFPRR
jgi:MraZ protein